jgi:hypothetical protein
LRSADSAPEHAFPERSDSLPKRAGNGAHPRRVVFRKVVAFHDGAKVFGLS